VNAGWSATSPLTTYATIATIQAAWQGPGTFTTPTTIRHSQGMLMNFKFDPATIWKRYFSSINTGIRACLGLAIVLAFGWASLPGNEQPVLERLELQAYDVRLRATMPNKPDSRIVIIDIDEQSMAAEGRWPWGRDKMALLVDQLTNRYKIRVIGFDIFFAEPDTSSGLKKLEALAEGPLKANAKFQQELAALRPQLDFDARFAESIKKSSVVLSFASSNDRADSTALNNLQIGTLPTPSLLVDAKSAKQVSAVTIPGFSGNLPAFQDASSATGHIIPNVDLDGVIRRIYGFIRYKDGFYETLSLGVYRTLLDNQALEYRFRDEGDNVVKFDTVRLKDAVIPLDDDSSMLIPYRGESPMFRYISATDILRGTLPAGELDGKIAFVGTSAQGLFDLRSTPVGGVYPGVETHATMVSGFLDNSLKRKAPFELLFKVLTLLLVGLPLAFLLVKLNALWSTISVTVAAAGLLALNMYWWHANLVVPIAAPILMIGLLYLFNMAYGFFVEDRSKRQITGMFGTYVPKELVAEMAKNPDSYSTKGESRDMTVLFSDVRNFTSISEGLSPTELTAMMNDYLTEMTKVIQGDRGTIDKYIGDAIMAFWGAPLTDEQHATHALASALAMQKRVRELGPDYVKRGWPKLEIGVGLNCGVMNVGDMGSSFRRAYTVLGDAVNLAARLEGLTKEYGVGILVSENIVRAVPNVVYRELDCVRVKGKLEPISIFEPVGLHAEVSNQVVDEIGQFQRVLRRYRAQKWDEAEDMLNALIAADPTRKVYRLYLTRVADLRNHPPGATWDGVFTFATK
jgi:adenylate cyclase